MEAKLSEPSLLISTFFGLTPKEAKKLRFNLFQQIHEIVFHGKGGYDWHTVYAMPLWLRKFTYNQISDFYSKEKQAIQKASSPEKSNQKTLISPDGKINTPEFLKASKQYKGKTSYK